MEDAIREICMKAKKSFFALSEISSEKKTEVLKNFKTSIESHRAAIEVANKEDRENYLKQPNSSESDPLYKRLVFEGSKIDSCIGGIDQLIKLDDVVGRCDLFNELADGLHLYRISCPIGVLLVIYEARPEAAVQIASLAIKSQNCLLLKGGKEARRSNLAVYTALHEVLKNTPGVPPDCIQLIEDREEVAQILKKDDLIDLVIPRGSNDLVKTIKRSTRIPVLGHADGICFVYCDEVLPSPMEKVVDIIIDSKIDYPAACNACECLIVHQKIAEKLLNALAESLKAKQIKVKADQRAIKAFPDSARSIVDPADPSDFATEWLAPTLSIKIVDSLDEAVQHINDNGSHHTDAIISDCDESIEQFMRRVDSAGVYANCSTRFADGFRYGFGAEVGVSTNKIHARGPVGLDGLLIYKYRLYGNGQTVTKTKNGQVVLKPKKRDLMGARVEDIERMETKRRRDERA